MSACDNKLRANLMEAMKLDDQNLEAEMQGVAPHVFSEVHEKKMEKLLQRQNRKRKVLSVLRYALTACLVLLLTGSILIISSKDLHASKLSIDIIEWLEEFFSTEKGKEIKREESAALFREEQIGYLPEGFEKIEEAEGFSIVYYKYQNDFGENIRVTVGKDKSSFQVDNTENVYEVHWNEAGYEYTSTYQVENGRGTIIWQDEDKTYYYISGIVAYEELIKVMNGITY